LSRQERSVSVDLWHNILWSRYKAAVFSCLHEQALATELSFRILHIASTDSARNSLSTVERELHHYPFTVLFDQVYDQVGFWRRMIKVAALAGASKASVVLIPGFDRPEYWAILAIAKLKGQTAGVFCDSTLYDKRRGIASNALKRIFIKLVDIVFCYGKRASEYVSWLGAPESKICIRCQAAYLPSDYDQEEVLSWRARSRDRDSASMLYVGRLSPEKDVGSLVTAHSKLLHDHPDLVLNIVGSGAEESQLRELSRAFGISHAVNFLGPLEGRDLKAQYLAADVLVLPSQSEPWGLVVNEALAYGCPVVVSDRCGCVPELVVEGVTGYTFRAGDADDLRRKIELVLIGRVGSPGCCVAAVAPYNSSASASQIVTGLESILKRLSYN
jgi:glycosyltransferase involved in cell wall biosynthesis